MSSIILSLLLISLGFCCGIVSVSKYLNNSSDMRVTTPPVSQLYLKEKKNTDDNMMTVTFHRQQFTDQLPGHVINIRSKL